MTKTPPKVCRSTRVQTQAPRVERRAKRATRTAPAPAPASATSTGTADAEPGGKLGIVAALLKSPHGATVAAMMEATGWQAHSVRGAIAGALKKKHGLTILSEKTDDGRIYRIAAEQSA